MTNDSTAETFTIAMTSLYVTLEAELDFEVESDYYLLLSVTDIGESLVGYRAVRVRFYQLLSILKQKVKELQSLIFACLSYLMFFSTLNEELFKSLVQFCSIYFSIRVNKLCIIKEPKSHCTILILISNFKLITKFKHCSIPGVDFYFKTLCLTFSLDSFIN